MSDLRTILERGVGGETPPPDGFERMLHRRDRKRRNQRIAAAVVGIAVFVAAVWIVTTGGWSDRSQTPAVNPPSVPPGVAVIDQAFVDSINDCERLLVTPLEVQSALGFDSMDPIPFGDTPNRLGVADPLSTGCAYSSISEVPGIGGDAGAGWRLRDDQCIHRPRASESVEPLPARGGHR